MDRIEAFAEPGIWAKGFRILTGLALLGVAGFLVYSLPSGRSDGAPTASQAAHVVAALACLAAATALIGFDDGARLRVGQDLRAYRARRAILRRVIDLAAGLSLVLSVAVAGLWVRSHFVRESVSWRQGPETSAREGAGGRTVTTEAGSFDGRLWVGFETSQAVSGDGPAAPSSAPAKPAWTWDRNANAAPPPADHLWQRLGFGLEWRRTTDTVSGRYALTFPIWLAGTAMAFFPAVRIYGRRRRRVRNTVPVGEVEFAPPPDAGPFEPLRRHT